MRWIVPTVLTLFLAVLAAPSLTAQEPVKPDTAEFRRLREQIEAINRRLEELTLGRDVVPQADSSLHGFGPAASKVYKVNQGVSIGGYGEFLYENVDDERQDGLPSGRRDRIDALRAIIYAGYRFDDQWLFNSEIEFEHASTGKVGEVSLEFAYLDYLATANVGVRAGLLLVPMGFLNELHEPPTFLGTTRPETERQLIPSTWRDMGIGLFGTTGDFSWRTYLVSGLTATGFRATGIRSGRQQGSQAVAENFAITARGDWHGVPGLVAGVSGYLGKAGQGAIPAGETTAVSARTFIGEAHADFKTKGFDLRGLVAVATIDDAADVNLLNGLTGNASVGDRLVGWYLHGGYDVLRGSGSSHQLIPYLRYEELNTQDGVPDGFTANPANDRNILSLGATWKPILNIAYKVDYQIHRSGARTGVDQLNVSLGYLF